MGIERKVLKISAVAVGLLGILVSTCSTDQQIDQRAPEHAKHGVRSDSAQIKTVQSDTAQNQPQEYRKNFDHWDQEQLTNVGISEDLAKQYDDRFDSWQSVRDAVNVGLTPEIAAQYPADYEWLFSNSGSIIIAFSGGVTPELAQQYGERFDVVSMVELHKHGIPPHAANAYKTEFNSYAIRLLWDANVPADIANAYDKRFMKWPSGTETIILAFQSGLMPNVATEYHEQLNGEQITDLHQAGVTAQRFEEYDAEFVESHGRRYDCHQVIVMHVAGVSPMEANRFVELNRTYGSAISGLDIVAFKQQEISYEEVAMRTREIMLAERIRN